LSALEKRILGEDGDISTPLTYDESKTLARHEDPLIRRALATRVEIPPEILYFLAQDSDVEVRRAAAANAALPHQADFALAKDADEAVRSEVAGKIAQIAPGLTAHEQDRQRNATYETLETLAKDQESGVRKIISETLKDSVDAPPDVIKKLAHDSEIDVSGPVLEHSPVLDDDDLLEIIGAGPAKGGLGAISRRARVNETVADAVAATDDVEAITDLLSNPSAQIREETLDNLIERAPEVELWHAPLVGRQELPEKAATRLATFVADSLLDVLQDRADLDDNTLAEVKRTVRQRVNDGAKASPPAAAGQAPDFLKIEPPMTVALRLFEAGKLEPIVVGKALHASDHAFVLAALAVRASLPIEMIQTIFAERSAKGVVSLAWRAGLSMKMALAMQQRMARVPPTELLEARGDSKFPLTEDEMAWHLEFFGNLSEK
jgi:uncharacterized protein (DUF2336 family)